MRARRAGAQGSWLIRTIKCLTWDLLGPPFPADHSWRFTLSDRPIWKRSMRTLSRLLPRKAVSELMTRLLKAATSSRHYDGNMVYVCRTKDGHSIHSPVPGNMGFVHRSSRSVQLPTANQVHHGNDILLWSIDPYHVRKHDCSFPSNDCERSEY